MSRPRLIIVTGAPATGKTTLAVNLGSQLRLPVLSKDLIKERLLESLDAESLRESQELGRAAFSVLFAVAQEFLDLGVSLILEAPFTHDASESDLSLLVERAAGVVIVCTASPELVVHRYRVRAISNERHHGHMDQVRPEMDHALALDPPQLGLPELRVNTSDGYQPTLQEVIGWLFQTSTSH